jgi:hydrogenase expression/formation protein HypD
VSLFAPFRNPELARGLAAAIAGTLRKHPHPVTLMEVCGTHTMAIGQHGLRALLPPQLRLVAGPGCPVCVTPIDFIDHAVALARRPGTMIATFGDMVRVPGSSSSLQREQATGAGVTVVYSPLDAVALAEKHPDRSVVFLGAGFETTAPATAGAVVSARRLGLANFFVLCAHKTIPAALALLAADPGLRVDGLLCPAHVSAIIGANAYRPLAEKHRIPCVITGFEPVDILQGVLMLVRQVVAGRARVENQYRRVVRPAGNRTAQALLAEVFDSCDTRWRGLGTIPGSGLRLRPAYAACEAARLPVVIEPPREPAGCRCGEVLTGKARPADCPLFGTVCTPADPVGACMVSSEGTCAAEYKYG